ncbi:Nucleic-acid-binding protein from transposon X-element, partial [Lucilia cuprina]
GSGFSGATNESQIRFALLGELDFDYTGDVDIRAARGGAMIDDPTGDNATQKGGFCPPIFLYSVNVTHLVAQLEAKSTKIVYKIKNVNKQKSKLYIADPAVHNEMMALLREKKIKSYSFTPKEFKQISLVLRGLYYKTDVQEIKSALDQLVPDTINNINKFTTALSRKNKVDTGLFLVVLAPGKKLTDISQIKYLLNQTVIWEKPKRKNHEIQYHRCQLWGYVARNCNSDFKCVKCDKSHPPGKCELSQIQNSKPTCVNCGEEGHPANWRGCVAYKKYVKGKLERLDKARKDNFLQCNKNHLTFASLFHSNLNNNNSKNRCSPIVEEFLKLSKLFLEPEEPTLEQEIHKFLIDYKNMQKSEVKDEVLNNWLLDHSLDVSRICDAGPSYPNGLSYLDRFLLSPHFTGSGIFNLKIYSCPTFSDHFPLKLEIDLQWGQIILNNPRHFTSYKNTNWSRFRNDLEISANDIMPSKYINLSNMELDILIEQFNANLSHIHNAHSERIIQSNCKIPTSDNIRKFFKIKHKWQKDLKKIFHRTGNRWSHQYNILSKQIQLLKNIIRELVNIEQADRFNGILEKIKPGPDAFRRVYQIVGREKSPFCQQITADNQTVINEREIADHFKDYYCDIYRDQRITSYTNNALPHIYQFNILYFQVFGQ